METSTDLQCLDRDQGPCGGDVDYRMPLTLTGRSFARCDRHWDERLRLEEETRRKYPDSPCPPSWFDYLDAGEQWDDD